MAATDIELCNEALGIIGHKKPISSLTASTVESQQAAIYYPKAKALVTARFWWKFCERTVLLAEHATATDERWDFVYVAPTGMAAPWAIWSGLRNPTADDAIPFQLGDAGTGSTPSPVILTDQEDARLIFTTNQLPIVSYPPHVQDAITALLAAYLCGPLPVDPHLAMGVKNESTRLLALAGALEANKGLRDVPQDPEFVRAR